jgi:hypothetical protein
MKACGMLLASQESNFIQLRRPVHPRRKRHKLLEMKISTRKRKGSKKVPVEKCQRKGPEKRALPRPEGNTKAPSTGEFLDKIQLFAVGLDLYGTIFFCNDHLLNVTGSRRNKVIGRNWFDTFALPSRRED